MNRIEKLEAMLQQTPGDNFLQHALALEYIKINNDSKARVLFESILVRDPDYVGSYYHLGKLLERGGKVSEAVAVFEKGMQACKKLNEKHAYNELQNALDDLTD